MSDDPIIQPFGLNDSAKEAKSLPQLYLKETEFNSKALSAMVSLIIGRRGTGKTALAQYLKFGQTDYEIYVGIDEPQIFSRTLELVASKMHGETILSVVDDLASIWELSFWTALMSELSASKGLPEGEYSKPIVKYLKHHNVVVYPGKASKVIKCILRDLSKLLSDKAATVIDLIYRVEEILNSGTFEEAKWALLKYFDRDAKAVIVIDTLEQYNVREESMQQAIGAMLHAVNRFSQGNVHRNLQIKCLLPAEIVPYLVESSVPNVGKSFEFPLYLHWRPKDLLRLICWRYLYYIRRNFPKIYTSVPDVDWDDFDDVKAKVWKRFFPALVTNALEMAEDSFQYIVRHTQLRPRQIIWICNYIAQESHEKRHFPNFTEGDVRRGVRKVEEQLASEILNSFMKVYPEVRSILSCMRGCKNILDGRHLDELAARSKKAWPISMPYDRNLFWQIVSELGLVGAVVNKTERYWEAEFEYTMQDRLILNEQDECVIHPLFYKTFRIKVSRERVVYPVGPDRMDEEQIF